MSMPAADKRLWLLCWIALALLVLVADFLTGPFIHLPFLFLFPVTLATWFSGKRWGLAMAGILPLVRISFAALWAAPRGMLEATVNGLVEMIVLTVFALLVDQAVQKKALYEEFEYCAGFFPFAVSASKYATKMASGSPWNNTLETVLMRSSAMGSAPPAAKSTTGNYSKMLKNAEGASSPE